MPKHYSVEEEFGVKKFGPYADSPRSIARTSVLYDVLNLTVLDAHIDTYETSEKDLAGRHYPAVDGKKDLVIMDRGYPGLASMYEMVAHGMNFLIRMREGWWLEVRKMLKDGETDKIVTFTLEKKDKAVVEKYPNQNGEIKCRLVVVTLPDGNTEVLCTSILDNAVLPYEHFAELYHYRWNIEEAYKLFKCRINLEAFSGKTALAVKQDFHAKIFMMTTTAVLAFPVEEQIKKECERENKPQNRKINRTNALSKVREVACNVFIKGMIVPALESLDDFLKKTTEKIRRFRKYPRKKQLKKPPSMNYKQL